MSLFVPDRVTCSAACRALGHASGAQGDAAAVALLRALVEHEQHAISVRRLHLDRRPPNRDVGSEQFAGQVVSGTSGGPAPGKVSLGPIQGEVGGT